MPRAAAALDAKAAAQHCPPVQRPAGSPPARAGPTSSLAWPPPLQARVEVRVKALGDNTIAGLRSRLAPTGFFTSVDMMPEYGDRCGASRHNRQRWSWRALRCGRVLAPARGCWTGCCLGLWVWPSLACPACASSPLPGPAGRLLRPCGDPGRVKQRIAKFRALRRPSQQAVPGQPAQQSVGRGHLQVHAGQPEGVQDAAAAAAARAHGAARSPGRGGPCRCRPGVCVCPGVGGGGGGAPEDANAPSLA